MPADARVAARHAVDVALAWLDSQLHVLSTADGIASGGIVYRGGQS